MRNITFSEYAFSEYMEWQMEDRKTLKRINMILKDIQRTPFEGIGNPEPLKGDKSGLWSRRIDEKNRIVYRVENEQISVAQCKGHYDK